jgi:hypothetical protein
MSAIRLAAAFATSLAAATALLLSGCATQGRSSPRPRRASSNARPRRRA